MVLLASCLATLCVVLLSQWGLLQGLEDRMLDARMRHWPRDATPMSNEIVLVAIDDKSLEQIGRWPWPRTRLADCIAELRRAGARTVALDLDLSDPQGPAWDAARGAIVDGDAALAQAADNRLVIAVLPSDDKLHLRWHDAGGDPERLDAVLGRLRTDPGGDPTEGLADGDLAAARSSTYMLRRAAIEQCIAGGESAEALLHRMGSQAATLEPLVRGAARRHAVRDALPGVVDHDVSRGHSPADKLPLVALAEQAGSVGYVTILHRDPDGAIRRLYGSVPMSDGQVVLPLGLAAVAMHIDETPASITVHDEHVRIGDHILPMSNGLITMNWPRSPTGPDWPDLHRTDASTPRFHGHIGMGAIAMLADSRRTLNAMEQQLQDQTALLLRAIRNDPGIQSSNWLSDEYVAEVQDEIDFTLGDVRTDEQLAELQTGTDDDTGALLLAMLRWRQLADAHGMAREQIADVEASLRSAVSDRLCFVGWTATGALADFVPTAVGPRTPGVVVHASLADMLLQERTLQEVPASTSISITAVLGLIAGFITAVVSPWAATLMVLLLAGLWLGIDLSALNTGLLLPAATPLVAMTASWATGTGTRAVLEQQARAHVTRQFRARVPGELVDELARNPAAVSMTGQRREVSVLFADLAGFTAASERMGSEATVALLNRCMRDLTGALTDHQAYVNKFLGDGLLAFWSAFHEQPDQATLACRAALACQQAIEAINADRPGEPPLHARIGIATGEAIVGDCGAPPRLNDYTVIGDTANLAARLESANKQFTTAILIDDTTHAQLDEPLHTRPLGPVGVVGREQAVQMFELLDAPLSQDVAEAWATLAAAMHAGEGVAQALDALSAAGVPDTSLALWRLHVDGDTDDPTVLRLTEK